MKWDLFVFVFYWCAVCASACVYFVQSVSEEMMSASGSASCCLDEFCRTLSYRKLRQRTRRRRVVAALRVLKHKHGKLLGHLIKSNKVYELETSSWRVSSPSVTGLLSTTQPPSINSSSRFCPSRLWSEGHRGSTTTSETTVTQTQTTWLFKSYETRQDVCVCLYLVFLLSRLISDSLRELGFRSRSRFLWSWAAVTEPVSKRLMSFLLKHETQ